MLLRALRSVERCSRVASREGLQIAKLGSRRISPSTGSIIVVFVVFFLFRLFIELSEHAVNPLDGLFDDRQNTRYAQLRDFLERKSLDHGRNHVVGDLGSELSDRLELFHCRAEVSFQVLELELELQLLLHSFELTRQSLFHSLRLSLELFLVTLQKLLPFVVLELASKLFTKFGSHPLKGVMQLVTAGPELLSELPLQIPT
jgi:hypothetical protein